MANNETDTTKNGNQPGLADKEKQNEQKKGFEQGNGNNSTTNDPKMRKEDSDSPTGQPEIDESLPENTPAEGESLEDDEDIDESKKNKPEIEGPYKGEEKTGSKVL